MDKDIEPKIKSDGRDYRLLRMLCIFDGTFSPIITGISMHNSPFFIYAAIFALVFSGIFFLIFYLTYKYKYFQRNAYYITCAITCLLTWIDLKILMIH
jgi:hypothetical protein